MTRDEAVALAREWLHEYQSSLPLQELSNVFAAAVLEQHAEIERLTASRDEALHELNDIRELADAYQAGEMKACRAERDLLRKLNVEMVENFLGPDAAEYKRNLLRAVKLHTGETDRLRAALKEACDELDLLGSKQAFRLRNKGGIES